MGQRRWEKRYWHRQTCRHLWLDFLDTWRSNGVLARSTRIVYGLNRRRDVRTHLASRTGYSIHRSCFLLVSKKRMSRGATLFPIYLPEGNSLISSLLFPESILLSRGKIRHWSFVASRNPRACFIFDIHSSFHIVRRFILSPIFSSYLIFSCVLSLYYPFFNNVNLFSFH